MVAILMNRTWLDNQPGIAGLVTCYVAYMAAAAFGVWVIVTPGIPILVWPPNGVILAVLLAHQRSYWPWWIGVAVLGEATANLVWFHNAALPALGYMAANALEVVIAAALLQHFLKPSDLRFSTITQVTAFLGIGVAAAPVIGATLGSAIDAAVGKNPFLVTWPRWWLGDATGILLGAPLVISAVNAWRAKAWPTGLQVLEAAGIAGLLILIGLWLSSDNLAYAFPLFIPILWAALRFEMRGSALAVLLLAIIIGFYAREADTSGRQPLDDAYHDAMLQLFVIVIASTGLIVAAIVRQYRKAATDLAINNMELEQRVATRTRQIEDAERRFEATFKNAAVGISIVDPDGVLIRVNQSMASMLGYRVEELEGQPLNMFTHEGDVAAGDLAWTKLRGGIADQYALEKRYVRKDGETVWAQVSVSCVRRPTGEIAYGIKVIQDITARKASDEARQLLMREVNHRSKNMLTLILTIARRTASTTPADFVERFERRLLALAANMDLLVASGWQPLSLEDLVRSQLSHFGDGLQDRFVIKGPPVFVPAHAAQAIGMALHELATNAAKYGSLSTDGGRVAIRWSVDGSEFHMSWQETGGPEVTKPTSRGFGSILIDTIVKSSLLGEVWIDFAPTGVEWRLKCPHDWHSQAAVSGSVANTRIN
jgi:PAS domain S-box-containing protein